MLFVLIIGIIGIIGIIARKEPPNPASTVRMPGMVSKPITRSNLRDLAPQLRIAKFNTDIDSIIDEVVRCASANLTKYTIVMRFLPFETTTSHVSLNTIFAFASDSVITAKIREVLVDSNSYEELRYPTRIMCKELIIEW